MNVLARNAIAVARADDLLRELNIQEPDEIDLERIALFKNAEVRYESLDGMDGCIVRDGGAAVITVNKSLQYDGQIRFVIAHELGHFFLHPNTRQIETVDADQTNNWSDKQEVEELEANLFAAELLMPKDLFMKHTEKKEPSLALLESMAKTFRTTLTATAAQFVLNTREECALVSAAGRQRLWFLTSKGFSFRFWENTYIHGHSCAAEVGANQRSARSNQIEADWWFEGFRGQHKALITEDARYFPLLRRSLSLLWIHDVI